MVLDLRCRKYHFFLSLSNFLVGGLTDGPNTGFFFSLLWFLVDAQLSF